MKDNTEEEEKGFGTTENRKAKMQDLEALDNKQLAGVDVLNLDEVILDMYLSTFCESICFQSAV